MTWSTVKTYGSGSIKFRLMIPGHPYEWVTDSSIAGASYDGRVRVDGLDASSITWGETLNPVSVKLSAQGFTAKIIDDGQYRTGDSLVKQPTKVNYLRLSIDSTTTVLPLVSSDIAINDVLYIGQECMLVTGNAATLNPTVTRGYRDTGAQSHYVDSSLGLVRPEVTNSRPSVEGSIAILYAYGDGETGDGDPVWRGIVATQPKLRDLHTWEIQIDSVVSMFDQTLSSDLQGPVTVRGIYYHLHTRPRISIVRHSGTTLGDAPTTDAAAIEVPLGFYADNTAFCAAVNAAITTATAGWSIPLNVAGGAAPKIVATPTEDGSWGFVFSSGAAPYWHTVNLSGPLDPLIRTGPVLSIWGTDTFTATVAANIDYGFLVDFPQDKSGSVPRGFVGYYSTVTPGRSGGGVNVADTLYLGGTSTMSTTDDAALITWPAAFGLPELTKSYSVTAWDATNRVATLRVTDRDSPRMFVAPNVPTITVNRHYADGNVGDFIAALVAGSAEGANAGRQPYITDEHVDSVVTLANVLSATEGRPWVAQRIYDGASDVGLMKVITEECKLAGLIPSIDTVGRLVLREFKMSSATDSHAYTIDADTNLSQAMLPGYEPSAYGLLNTIKVSTGFDPLDGEHHGDTIYVRDADALSRNPLPMLMKIEPRSTALIGDTAVNYDDIVAMAQQWMGVLGTAYVTVTVACPLSAIDATIGESVSLTISQIPDAYGGGRGVTLATGIVIGRRVRPLDAIVELTVLTTQTRIAGYTSSSDIASVVDDGGGDFTITLATTQPYGYVGGLAFVVGETIIIAQYDQASPSEITAVVTAVDSATVIHVNGLSGALPSGHITCEFPNAPDTSERNRTYAYIASSDDQIPFPTPVPARQFAS